MPLDIVRSFLDKETDERRCFLEIFTEFERQFGVSLPILADTLHDSVRVNEKFREKTHVIQHLALIVGTGEFDQRCKIVGVPQCAPGIALERRYKGCRFLADDHAQRMEVAIG